jgi:Co/Zn/Cd efflux system component
VSAGCGNGCAPDAGVVGAYRKVLWLVLIMNFTMFVTESAAGWAANSVSLQADALDFLGDSAAYLISLVVAARSIRWRAGAALLKGGAMGVFGVWVIGMTLYRLIHPELPGAVVMGSIGGLALAVNITAAMLLMRFRDGDSNMRSVWLCSRNDALANLAVLVAASGVFAAGSNWPDLLVGAGIAALALTGSWQVVRHALSELKAAGEPVPVPVSGD